MTSRTEEYAIGDIHGLVKLVRCNVLLHSWQNLVFFTTAECFALIESAADLKFQEINYEKYTSIVDESAVCFLMLE